MSFDDLRRPPLDAAALVSALTRPGSLWTQVHVLAESESTNAALAQLARERARAPAREGADVDGSLEGTVLVAEHQTAGRGRLGRSWVTPPRAALTFSVLLEPRDVPPTAWPWLPLLVGAAVGEAVQRVTGLETSLKWPNDVLVGDAKVAGILVEQIDVGRRGAAGPLAVVGIGLNVSSTRAELPVETATSLALAGAGMLDRSVLLREILRVLEALYLQWAAEKGSALGLRSSYVRRCATIGEEVTVMLPGGERLSGRATGVDGQGRLTVATPRGDRAVGAGDVVHVRRAGGPS